MPIPLALRWLQAGLASLAWSVALAAHAAASTTWWSPSWMASTQPVWGSDFILPSGLPPHLEQQTLRQLARLSIGGSRLRVVLSNEGGSAPLHIAAAWVARPAQGAAIAPGSTRRLRFGGQDHVTLPPGARLASDPVDLPLPDLARVAVSVYLPQASAPAGFHFDARETAYLAQGDHSGAAALPANAKQLNSRLYVSAVLVETAQPPATVVALGDSLTDGNGATPGADTRWPDALAQRLAGRGVAVLNAGISGGRLLKDGMGRSALERLGRDVFAQPGVRALVVLLGVNDLGWPGGPFAPHERPASADDIIQGLRLLAQQAQAHNVRAIAGTIAPLEDALAGTPLQGHYSADKERVRQAVNQWIRGSGAFDAVLDFDLRLRDPARPSRLLPALDSGDHLHPGDAGYKAMADLVDLEQLLAR